MRKIIYNNIFKLKHIAYSLKKSLPKIIVCVLLSVITVVLNLVFSNELWMQFGVGIAASIVATLIIGISDVYLTSINTEQDIIFQTTLLINFYERNISEENFEEKSFSDDIEKMYYQICSLSKGLAYRGYYKMLLTSIKSFINCLIDTGYDFNDSIEMKEKLIGIINDYPLNSKY